jgi:hypothetical protein
MKHYHHCCEQITKLLLALLQINSPPCALTLASMPSMIIKSGKPLQQIEFRLLALPPEICHHQLNPVVLPARVSSPRPFAWAQGSFGTRNEIIEVGRTFDMSGLEKQSQNLAEALKLSVVEGSWQRLRGFDLCCTIILQLVSNIYCNQKISLPLYSTFSRPKEAKTIP